MPVLVYIAETVKYVNSTRIAAFQLNLILL